MNETYLTILHKAVNIFIIKLSENIVALSSEIFYFISPEIIKTEFLPTIKEEEKKEKKEKEKKKRKLHWTSSTVTWFVKHRLPILCLEDLCLHTALFWSSFLLPCHVEVQTPLPSGACCKECHLKKMSEITLQRC